MGQDGEDAGFKGEGLEAVICQIIVGRQGGEQPQKQECDESEMPGGAFGRLWLEVFWFEVF
ncbi:MAG: hypothetical protein U9Q39_03135 [Pseudomonadota bacterium]|nr:hypothetical protein [Pseudomonadota bacterium]